MAKIIIDLVATLDMTVSVMEGKMVVLIAGVRFGRGEHLKTKITCITNNSFEPINSIFFVFCAMHSV